MWTKKKKKFLDFVFIRDRLNHFFFFCFSRHHSKCYCFIIIYNWKGSMERVIPKKRLNRVLLARPIIRFIPAEYIMMMWLLLLLLLLCCFRSYFSFESLSCSSSFHCLLLSSPTQFVKSIRTHSNYYCFTFSFYILHILDQKNRSFLNIYLIFDPLMYHKS